MNKSEAIKATKNGAIAACISGVITIGLTLIAMSRDMSGKLAIFNDPAIFIDVVFIFACAFGVYKKSRVAAVLLFVYFIVSKIIIALETHSSGGFGVALVFLYFYGKAIQGSFVFHKLEKEENPDYKATTKWSYIIGIPAVLVMVLTIAIALMSTTGVMPSTRVQTGSEMRNEDISILKAQGIIYAEDTVEYFYAQGLSSILEGGNILTQDRVIVYINSEEEGLKAYALPINEITDVVLESQGGSFSTSEYKVNTRDPDRWLKLSLSGEQKGDRQFVRALRAKLENSKTGQHQFTFPNLQH
jgi:hypothetical protein